MQVHRCYRCYRCRGEFPREAIVRVGKGWACKPCKSDLNLRNRYKITREQFDKMWQDQSGGCAICAKPLEQVANKCVVDHCHHTGAVRGLLCRMCNTGLGYLGDTAAGLERAVNYLKRSERGNERHDQL